MATEDAFVKAAMNAWNSNMKSVDSFLAGISDEGLQAEIAPGKNRLFYLMGHLAAVHDRMFALLGVGERLHPELDQPFLVSKDRQSETPSVADVRKAYAEINSALTTALSALSAADWLAKHTAVSDEDFAKEPHRNRYSVLVSRTIHIYYHYGQMVLAPKAA